MISDRERFCAALANQPMWPASAMMVFSGDGTERLEVALGLLKQGAAHHVIVSGGLDDPPHSLTAEAMGDWLIERGLSPDRLIYERESQNTYDQAQWLASFLVDPPEPWEWPHVILVTSPYHQYRAHLTVLWALMERDLNELCHIYAVSGGHAGWWKTPDGRTSTRMELLADEFCKIDKYKKRGHVASYAWGLDYLEFWEGRE